MSRFLRYLNGKPMDVKVFIFSCIMIFGFFLFPEEPRNITVLTTYIVFIFISIAISGFYITWVQDSQYNFFRKVSTTKNIFVTISLYIVVCVTIAYILTVTGWFLFIIG